MLVESFLLTGLFGKANLIVLRLKVNIGRCSESLHLPLGFLNIIPFILGKAYVQLKDLL